MQYFTDYNNITIKIPIRSLMISINTFFNVNQFSAVKFNCI